MKNRRSLSTTPVLSTAAAGISPRGEGDRPFSADIADPCYARRLADSNTDLFVRMEELDPADPGELSGAELRVHESGQDTQVTAGIGDTLQPYGYRSSHFLGWLPSAETCALASADLTAADREPIFVAFRERPDTADNRIWLKLSTGENPAAALDIAGHCLGVLRGDLLVRFLDCIRKRSALKIAA